jgi:hypothetical protein
VLHAAVSAYLGRYRGDSRFHTESDLRILHAWCTEQDLEPLSAVRADIERYVRWLQDVRRFQPSAVSRRALHAQTDHAQRVAAAGGDLMVSVKGNRPTLFAQLKALPWGQVPVGDRRREHGHGRRETRTVRRSP